MVAINAALLIVTFPVAPGIERPARADATAAGASPAIAGAPNVIVMVLDTLRADHMSTYGYQYDTTPNIDAFAAGATVFEPGIANATWSLTSHASLLTGLLPHQHGAHAVLASISQSAEERGAGGAAETFALAQRPLAAEHETLAETLAQRGYTTAAVVANFGWLSDFFGLLQGFDYVDSRPMNLFPREPVAAPYVRRLPWEAINDRYILLNKSAWFGDAIVEHALAWEEQRPERPFFLFLNFMDAHAPFRASLMTADYDGRLPDPDPGGDPTSYSIARYDRSIAYLDRQVGALLDHLRERDLFDNSLIVITSDHGENFAPERPASHGAELLQDTVVVPLIIKMPGQTTGDRPARPGQLVDVVPTVRAALGIDADPEMFGSPLAESPRAIVAENYFSGLYGAYADEFVGTEAEMLAAFPSRWALFEGPWKLVRPVAGSARLYDLAADPAGRRDVRGQHPGIAAAMELRLSELLPDRAFNAARLVTPVELPDALTIERLRSLGYLR